MKRLWAHALLVRRGLEGCCALAVLGILLPEYLHLGEPAIRLTYSLALFLGVTALVGTALDFVDLATRGSPSFLAAALVLLVSGAALYAIDRIYILRSPWKGAARAGVVGLLGLGGICIIIAVNWLATTPRVIVRRARLYGERKAFRTVNAAILTLASTTVVVVGSIRLSRL